MSDGMARAPRADAQRNQRALLAAAAEVFVSSGVDAPVREIARQAGVGVATIYRHFPSRSELIVAVYRHQIDFCATAGPELLEARESPHAALAEWIDLFVDFLVTKHGLAEALHSDEGAFSGLHGEFIDRLVPVCADLLQAACEAGEVRADIEAYALMRGVGNLCIGGEGGGDYQPRRLVRLLVRGLRCADLG